MAQGTTTLTLTVPTAFADAIRAEALRQMRLPGEVVTDALRLAFPPYVESRLQKDLKHPLIGRVISTRAVGGAGRDTDPHTGVDQPLGDQRALPL